MLHVGGIRATGELHVSQLHSVLESRIAAIADVVLSLYLSQAGGAWHAMRVAPNQVSTRPPLIHF